MRMRSTAPGAGIQLANLNVLPIVISIGNQATSFQAEFDCSILQTDISHRADLKIAPNTAGQSCP